jgi:ABC-type cobalamin/Fe3+-siderophores transport system ATPase subunit
MSETELIKLAWIGAQGSGKTTTVNRVSRMLSDSRIPNRVVIEKARMCPHPLQSFKAQEWMVHEQIRDEEYTEKVLAIIAKEKHPPYVFELCDRSIWDSLVYMTYMNRKGVVTDAELHTIDSLISGYLDKMLTYNEIYFCEIKALYDDPKRPNDEQYQADIYKLFKEIIKERGIRVTMVQ